MLLASSADTGLNKLRSRAQVKPRLREAKKRGYMHNKNFGSMDRHVLESLSLDCLAKFSLSRMLSVRWKPSCNPTAHAPDLAKKVRVLPIDVALLPKLWEFLTDIDWLLKLWEFLTDASWAPKLLLFLIIKDCLPKRCGEDLPAEVTSCRGGRLPVGLIAYSMQTHVDADGILSSMS